MRVAGTAPSHSGHAALCGRDLAGAQACLDAVQSIGRRGRWLAAGRTTIRAGIAALEDRPDEARSLYSESLRGWHELGMPWEEALTAIDMATLLDPADPAVRAAAQAAHEILAGLGARPFVERLAEAMARTGAAPLATGSP